MEEQRYRSASGAPIALRRRQHSASCRELAVRCPRLQLRSLSAATSAAWLAAYGLFVLSEVPTAPRAAAAGPASTRLPPSPPPPLRGSDAEGWRGGPALSLRPARIPEWGGVIEGPWLSSDRVGGSVCPQSPPAWREPCSLCPAAPREWAVLAKEGGTVVYPRPPPCSQNAEVVDGDEYVVKKRGPCKAVAWVPLVASQMPLLVRSPLPDRVDVCTSWVMPSAFLWVHITDVYLERWVVGVWNKEYIEEGEWLLIPKGVFLSDSRERCTVSVIYLLMFLSQGSKTLAVQIS